MPADVLRSAPRRRLISTKLQDVMGCDYRKMAGWLAGRCQGVGVLGELSEMTVRHHVEKPA